MINCYRKLYALKKSKIFWCCWIFMVILALIGPVGQYFQAQKYASFEPMIDGQLFTFAMFIGIVLSTFCGLFLGIGIRGRNYKEQGGCRS